MKISHTDMNLIHFNLCNQTTQYLFVFFVYGYGDLCENAHDTNYH